MERTQQTLSVGQKKNKTQAQAKQGAAPTAPHKDQRSKRSKKPQPQSAQAAAQAGMTQPRAHTGLQPMSAQQAAAPATASTPPVAQQPRMTMSKTKKIVKKAAANHILVVAHPSAQAQQVFDLLKAAGVQEALPSRREQLSAQALTETLLKAHGLQWSNGQVPTSIESVEASPMWQSLVLDLVLGNMDQPLWAWLDPQAVHLLDFWQQQSEHTVFMLVYDDIHNIYQQCLQGDADASPESINVKVQSWVAYNEALLQFHLRNPERSFLVHAKQVAQSAQSYVQQINQRVAAPLQLAAGHRTASEQPSSQQLACTEMQTQPSATIQPGTDGLANWLIEQLVQMQSDAVHLYEKLQAAADLPRAQFSIPITMAGSAVLNQVWGSFVLAQRQQNYQLQELLKQTSMHEQAQANLEIKINNIKSENLNLLEKLHKIQEEFYELSREKENNTKLLASDLSNKNADVLIDELKKENYFLLKQLHMAQEDFFQICLEKKNKNIKKSNDYYGAAERVKQQLSYRIGSTIVSNSRSLSGWIKMPFLLRREINEFKKNKSKGMIEKKPPISHYKDVYEADRIKKHLSYKLGYCVVKNSKSLTGWAKMPFAMISTVIRFKKQ